jgi:hypothetical protein
MKLILSILLIFCLSTVLSAQETIVLKSPLLVEQDEGEPVILKIEWDNQYQISWISTIDSLQFDEQEGEFFWEQTHVGIGLHQITIQLKDSSQQIVKEASTIIKINQIPIRPTISFIPDSLQNGIFIELKQGTAYQLEFEAVAQTEELNDNQKVLISYLINDSPGLKAFDQSEIVLVGNHILVKWKPTQAQAYRRYHDLQLIAIDKNNQVTRKTFHFKVLDEDLPPSFKYVINNSYTIAPDRMLTIDFSVNDPDGDEYYYQANLSSRLGLINISREGQFSWKLNSNEIASLADDFPIPLRLQVLHMRSGEEMASKTVEIVLTRDNAPPEITRLSNLSVKEGYAIRRRIFYQDSNHEVSQLDFKLENAPAWLYLEQEGEALYLVSDTIAFNVVKADGIAVQYDVLLTVTDPQNASDNQFFTVTVTEGINANDIYAKYTMYQAFTDKLLIGMRDKVSELENKLESNGKLKRGFLITSILLGGYSGVASFFEEETFARQAVPYTGAVLAVTSSINALAFNQDADITSVKVKLEQIEKEFIRNKSYLQLYDITSEQDDQLRNTEVVTKIKSYRQQLIEQKIELEKLEEEYRQLNYVKRKIRKDERKGKPDSVEWVFLSNN